MGHTARVSGTRSMFGTRNMLKIFVSKRHGRIQYGEPTETLGITYLMKVKYDIKMWTGFNWLTIA
jgi:hypothetical protein